MRIVGITIPDNKQLAFALRAVYGIGPTRAIKVLDAAKIDPTKKTKDLTAEQEKTITKLVEEFKIEGDLRREVASNIKRHKDIGTYRGGRHSRSLPVRGQRTNTNSRTVRGNVRKTMMSGKTKVEKK